MPAQQPRLAKLTRPRLARAVPRERLFARLNEARAQQPCGSSSVGWQICPPIGISTGAREKSCSPALLRT